MLAFVNETKMKKKMSASRYVFFSLIVVFFKIQLSIYVNDMKWNVPSARESLLTFHDCTFIAFNGVHYVHKNIKKT